MPTSPGPLLSAVSTLWQRLRSNVPDLPDIVPAVSPTTRRLDHGQERWARDEEGRVSGLVLTVDVLQEGPECALDMILHDAAHILCWTRGIAETTMHGVYHNAQFLTAAEEVGLTWPEDATRVRGKGYHTPVLTPETKERYAENMRELEEAIPLVLPHLELPPTSNRGRVDRLTLRCKCKPARSFRISRTIAAQGAIHCAVCDNDFTED
ncbi:putative DNA dependent metalloprotease [Streptomyces phage Samy]|nr:putative DNA dependent metalloprotease [Streptomyces phage Samy]